MNKNPEATKQYLADRTARAGAELRELTGTDTVLLPVTGDDKLYVAVGPLAGIAQVAGKSFDEAAGNTNKAVLTDEQIDEIAHEKWVLDGSDTKDFAYIPFARAIEAAVLANASKADVCAQMRALCSACGGTGDVHSIDGEWRGACDCEASLAAPAPADNPSTAGAGTPRVDALMAKWDDDGATRGSAFCELRDIARELESSLAAPALNPSDVRVNELEAEVKRLTERLEKKHASHFLASQALHNTLVGNQSAWIEWQHGAGAEAAMVWIHNGLAGPGLIPDGKEAQPWFDANQDDRYDIPPMTAEVKATAAQSVEGGDGD